VRDTAHMLKEGVPSVVLVHAPFERAARSQLRLLGIPETDKVVIAYPTDRPSAEGPEELMIKAREQAQKLLGMLTSQKWQPESK
jgi:hypothetical protein